MERGSEAYLDPSVTPVSPPTPEGYSYTPRKSVMSALESSKNTPFIKAQIANDDRELREIIKETVRSDSSASRVATARTRKNNLASSPVAEPQRAVLMEVQPNLYPDFRNLPQVNHKQHAFQFARQSWKPRPARI